MCGHRPLTEIEAQHDNEETCDIRHIARSHRHEYRRESQGQRTQHCIAPPYPETNEACMEEIDESNRYRQQRQPDDCKGKTEGFDEQSTPRDDPSEHRRSPAVIDEAPRPRELKSRSHIRPVILKAHLRNRVGRQYTGGDEKRTDQPITIFVRLISHSSYNGRTRHLSAKPDGISDTAVFSVVENTYRQIWGLGSGNSIAIANVVVPAS